MNQYHCHPSHYRRIGLPANYHHQLQETWHISVPFITSGPGTGSAGLGDMKLLNWSDQFFLWIVLTLVFYWNIVKSKMWNANVQCNLWLIELLKLHDSLSCQLYDVPTAVMWYRSHSALAFTVSRNLLVFDWEWDWAVLGRNMSFDCWMNMVTYWAVSQSCCKTVAHKPCEVAVWVVWWWMI